MASNNSLRYLTATDWSLIASVAKQVTFSLGQEIITQGRSLDCIYIIRHGSASVQVAGTRSKTVMAVLKAGDVCGEMAFLQKTAASASVIASDTKVHVDEIPARELQRLVETLPGFAARFYHSLAVILANRLQRTSGELVRQ